MQLEKYFKNTYVKYTFAFVICISCILFIFVIRNISLIGDGDSFNQSYPIFVYIGEYLRNIFRGNVKTFDFRIGFGEDVVSVLNYYGFGDLFSIVSILFPKEYSEIGYNIVMVLKLFSCGIAFIIYGKKYIRTDTIIISGALMYSLSTFILFRGLGFWMFINPALLYPLILRGIDEICIEDKKISWILIFSVWWQALNGFYFFYVNTILSFIYFIILFFCNSKKKDNKYFKLLKDIISLLYQVILGVGAGAIIFIPGMIGYFNSSRTGRGIVFEEIHEYFFYEVNFYLNNIKGLLIPNIWESITTLPIVVLLATIIAILSKKCNIQFKILVICFIVLYNFPLFCSLMNGFSEVSDRWYYAITLFTIILGCIGIEKEKQVPRQIIVFFLIFTLIIIIYDIITTNFRVEAVLRDSILLVCILLTIYIMKFEDREKKILPWTCALIIINGLIIMAPDKLGGRGYSWAFVPKGKIFQDIESSFNNIEFKDDEKFTRIDIQGISLGASLIKDYYGTSEYFSILNKHISEFYRNLAISPGLRSASWILKGLDGRQEIMSILSVSQYIDYCVDTEIITSNIKENIFKLPLAFTYDKWIKKEEFENLNPLHKQNMMLEAVVLEEEYTKENKIMHNSVTVGSKIDYSCGYFGIKLENNMLNAEERSKLRLYIKTEKDNLYIFLKDFIVYDEGVHEIYVGNKNLQLRNKNDGYYMGIDDFCINVTDLKEINGYKYFDILFLEECQYSIPNIEIHENDISGEEIRERRKYILENTELGNNYVRGNINLPKDKILFLSIPYSNGWKAYINGVETEILKANIGFSAIIVQAGKHDIYFKYETPGIKLGCMCSVLSTCILLYIFRRLYFENSIE